jgi:dephospho-CoA kinase
MADADRPFVIGLTGPLGCGKSTIARMLGELGGAVIDADALAREATAPGQPALERIRERFGPHVFGADGVFDRAAMAAIVFADPAALDDLEAIVHPQVRARVEAAMAQAEADRSMFVVIEAIKLVEGGLADRCDEVWLVECDPAVQRERALARGIRPDDLERRLEAQGPDLAERLARRATRRIVTDGPLEVTRDRVEDALADALAPRLLDSA